MFYDFCGRMRLNFASRVSTTSLLSLNSEWSYIINSDVPAETGGKTKAYDIFLMICFKLILNISYLILLNLQQICKNNLK